MDESAAHPDVSFQCLRPALNDCAGTTRPQPSSFLPADPPAGERIACELEYANRADETTAPRLKPARLDREHGRA